MTIAKEQIRQMITENNFTNVADVYAYLKEGFILQELMEAEIHADLGYEKNQNSDYASNNKRNRYSAKTLKSQYGEFPIDIPPETVMVSSNQNGFQNTREIFLGLKKK